MIIAFALMCTSTAPLLSRPGPSALAVLTEKHGQVFKRLFLDQQRTVWDKPRPAQAGDVLNEGTQVATAAKSWAQIAFPNITARTWENSVVLITPNRKIVYLMGGQMLVSLKKDRPHKDDYAVWTKVLQIRFRGTTVLVKDEPGQETVTVLEGCASVKNRFDHSMVDIKPGVALEVEYPKDLKFEPPPIQASHDFKWESEQNNLYTQTKGSDNVGATESPASNLLKEDTDERIYKPDAPAITLFKTADTKSSLHAVSAKDISQHPLLTSFDTTFTNQALVNDSLAMLDSKGHDSKTLKQIIIDNSKIISLPTDVEYKITPEAERTLNISSQPGESLPDRLTEGQPELSEKGQKSTDSSSTNNLVKATEELSTKDKEGASVASPNHPSAEGLKQAPTLPSSPEQSQELSPTQPPLPANSAQTEASPPAEPPSPSSWDKYQDTAPVESPSSPVPPQEPPTTESPLPSSWDESQDLTPMDSTFPSSLAPPQEPPAAEPTLPIASADPEEPPPPEPNFAESSATPQEPSPAEPFFPTAPPELQDPAAPAIPFE